MDEIMANDAKDSGGREVRVISVDGPMPSRRFKTTKQFGALDRMGNAVYGDSKQ